MERKWPFFSIIIPTRNRPEQLVVCLQSLARLDYPRKSFEVIVVNDGGRKPREKAAALPHNVLSLTILEQPHAGPAIARNTGANIARGEFLAFLDDDCVPATDWLRRLADRFATSPDCAIGGRTVNALRENCYAAASQLLVDYLHSYYNADPYQSRFLTSNNLALPADRFRIIGRFNPQYPFAGAEDRDLCRRWLQHGYRIIHESEAIVHHAHALSFRTFWDQHFRYGRGALLYHRLGAARRGGCLLFEPKLFYTNLVLYPLSAVRKKRAPLCWLLMVSQVVNALGFLWAWVKEKND